MRAGLLGVIGYPIGHNVLSQMINTALRHEGIQNILCIPIDVKPRDLEAFCRSAPLMNFIGFNVTMPHKVSIIEHLDRLDASAKEAAAVNVVKIVGDRLIGYNTDIAGMLAVLPSKKIVDGPVVVLGVGDAARAAAIALKKKGFQEVVFVGRRADRIELFKEFAEDRRIECRFVRIGSAEFADAVKRCRILINATQVGMYPKVHTSPVENKLLHPRMLVFDIVYNPPETRLLKAAKAKGAKTINGVRMLVAQGAEALKIWLGLKTDQQVMTRAVLKALKEFKG